MEGKIIQPEVLNLFGPTIIGNNNRMMGVNKCDENFLPGLNENITKIPDDLENFVGRNMVLDEVTASFHRTKFVVLHGMTGVGKSAVAIKHAHRQSLQYQNRIWVSMDEVFVAKKKECIFEEICRYILRKVYVNINDISQSDDLCSHLEFTFRRLCSSNKQTLITLDNLEEFLVIAEDEYCGGFLPFAIKRLVDMAIENGKGVIHILGTSRCKADEQFFRGVKNIDLMPFTPEEMRTFLAFYPKAIYEHSEILHQTSCGFPLILEIYAKNLNNINNERDVEVFLAQIQEKPVKTASPHVENCLNASLRILADKEMKLAETLSFFQGEMSLEHAKALCKEVGTEISYIQQLVDKGIIKSTKTGYSMHPFLREIINDKIPQFAGLRYKATLAVVYIRDLLKLSSASFQKDKSASTVKVFQDRMSSFIHFISMIDSCYHGDRENYILEVKTLVEKGTLNDEDPCSFYLLLKFLYYLAPRTKIRTIFKFLLDVSCHENTNSMIRACLDELDFKPSGSQSFNENSQKYEYVMFRCRQLSEEIKGINCKRSSNMNNVKMELNRLMKIVDELDNEQIKAYYTININKLQGALAVSQKKFSEAIDYYKISSSISERNFGASFWTIDSYENAAKCLAKIGDDKASEWFEKAFNMTKSSGCITVLRIRTLLWAYAKYLLKQENQRERAIEPLEKILKICYYHREYALFSKAFAILCNMPTQYSQNMTKVIRRLEIPDKVLIELVDKLFYMKLGITGRTIDKEIIQKETMAGIDVLISAICTVRHGANYEKGDAKLLEKAIYNWNKNIALHCSHVMLESERKKYAVEALSLVEGNKFGSEYDVQYLKFVRESNNNKKDEQMILEVTFLGKTNKMMKAKGMHAEQKEKILKILEDCQQNWLKLKLLTCLLELMSNGYEKAIGLMNEIANIYCNESSPQSKPIYTIYNAAQNINVTKLLNEEKLQLRNTCQKLINKLGEGSSKKKIKMKCNFMILYIALLQELDDSNPEIELLMQMVLDYINEHKLSEDKRVERKYQKYIKDHKSIISQVCNGINKLLSNLLLV